MEIYIELLLINNFALNFMLNFLAVKFSSLYFSIKKITIASLISAVYTLLFIYVDKYMILFQIVGFFFICAILSKYKNVFEYLKLCFSYFSVAMICTIGFSFINISYNINVYDISFSCRLIIVYVIFLSLIFIHKIVKFIFIKNKNEMKYFEMVKIYHKNMKFKLSAYYDCANVLYDKNDFVCVIDEKIANKLKLEKKYLLVDTVIGNKNMQYITLDKVELLDTKKIFSKVKCLVSSSTKYEFLIHRDMR